MDSNQENINILFQSYRYITVPVKELVVIDLVSKFTLYLCIICFSEPGPYARIRIRTFSWVWVQIGTNSAPKIRIHKNAVKSYIQAKKSFI